MSHVKRTPRNKKPFIYDQAAINKKPLTSVKEDFKESEATQVESFGQASPQRFLSSPEMIGITTTEKKGFCMVRQPSLVSTGPQANLETQIASPNKSPENQTNPLKLSDSEVILEDLTKIFDKTKDMII